MRIVIGGYMVGYPLGGTSWHHVNYLAGLAELGHDVWFYEDSGEWSLPYNPVDDSVSSDPTYGVEYLRRTMESIGLQDRFCYYSELENRWYGRSKTEWHEILRDSDLVLCVSGVTPWRDEFSNARRTCVIDTDPVYTQLRMTVDHDFAAYYRSFDRVATFGRTIGTEFSEVPTAGVNWIHTHQPVVMSKWQRATATSSTFSTMGRWDHGAEREFEFNGRVLQSSKGVNWARLLDLPGRTGARLAMAMSGVPLETQRCFEKHGWHFTDPAADSISIDAYQQFINRQLGEFTVAKQIYVELPSGWFSDRGACYLAAGKPVITQPTGFEHWLPTGTGLLAYSTLEEAAEALDDVMSNYDRHSNAAREIAEEYFDSRIVLRQLLRSLEL